MYFSMKKLKYSVYIQDHVSVYTVTNWVSPFGQKGDKLDLSTKLSILLEIKEGHEVCMEGCVLQAAKRSNQT